MTAKMDIDARGFRDMIRTLEKKTGASYRDVVRDTATKVLASTASRTRTSTEKNAEEKVDRLFRKPVRLSNGDKVGVTKKGRVWFQQSGWDRKNWVLVSRDGRLNPPKSKVFRTSRSGRQYQYKLPSRLKAEISQAVQMARNIMERESKYAKSVVGIGRKSWIHLMQTLRLKVPSKAKLTEVLNVKLPQSVKSVLSAKEEGRDDKFVIVISTKVQSALNKKARGFSAFRQSINQQSRTFKKNAEKDLEKYVKRFARRNGFIVK